MDFLRDIRRIRLFCSRLAKAWENNAPDSRFGQLMVNVFETMGKDLFYPEDEEMIAYIEKFLGDDSNQNTKGINDDVLLCYTTDCQIRLSDVSDFWMWDTRDTEVKLNHKNDKELIFTLIPPRMKQRIVVFWDKELRKVTSHTGEWNCYDAIRFNGHTFTLSIEETGKQPLLVVRQWDHKPEAGDIVYKTPTELPTIWTEPLLREENGILYIVQNIKRFVVMDTNRPTAG